MPWGPLGPLWLYHCYGGSLWLYHSHGAIYGFFIAIGAHTFFSTRGPKFLSATLGAPIRLQLTFPLISLRGNFFLSFSSSERKGDDFRSTKKFGKDDVDKKRQGSSHGYEKKPGKSHGDWKEKRGQKEEKEKTVRKVSGSNTFSHFLTGIVFVFLK